MKKMYGIILLDNFAEEKDAAVVLVGAPIPLLIFHVARAFGNAKSLVNLITK